MENEKANSADTQHIITVKANVTKVVFYNPYEPVMIEFEYGYRLPANEVLIGGINSLCMCNAKWRTAVHAKHMKIQVDQKTHDGASKYYLRQITAVASDANTLHICVEKKGAILELPFLCMMQIRSRNFVDCGHLAVRNLQEILPHPVRRIIGIHSDQLHAQYFDMEGETVRRSCTNYDHRYCEVQHIPGYPS